jgi:ArsR family transcriptional regulator, arsenate/arsenite/antimonite-responsive transcriptional repressor
MAVDVDTLPGALPTARALADPLRWRIVELLSREQLCVCHLTEELDVPQPLVSHHLRILRDAGLVEGERWRYWTYYRLRPAGLEALTGALHDLAARAPGGDADRRPCC